MKYQRNIFIAFLLNLTFAVFEFAGGILTGSVAILSDAIHDLGDAASIGVSFFMEKKSKRQPDEVYTFGYARYSVLGSVITTLTLLLGTVVVVYHAIQRLITPVTVHYNGMILFAVVGVCVNLCAALVTGKGESLNQKAVNLHMLEDVLGWMVVLIGAVVMRFTEFVRLDSVLSIGVALFIGIHAVKHLKEALDVFLEKMPVGLKTKKIQEEILGLPGVLDAHHFHFWSMDNQRHYATMHIVTNEEPEYMKKTVRAKLSECGIDHATLEMERENEPCSAKYCYVTCKERKIGCHQHHTH